MIGVVTVLAGALALALAVLIVVLVRARRPTGEGVLMLQQQLDALREQTASAIVGNTDVVNRRLEGMTGELNQRLATLDKRMESTTGLIGERLDSAHRAVQNVSSSLGELSHASKQIYEVGKNIASLEDILRAPKLRGIVGEYFLEDLLRQVVPGCYESQYRFASGEAVDAVIRLGSKLVPVDAKFPLEGFRRVLDEKNPAEQVTVRKRFLADVRKHVDAVAKYIVPDEGTFDFALMYVPAENVYYEMITKNAPEEDDLNQYALARRVVPVSPNSFYAYLQVIVLGLRGFRIERKAQEILEHLGRLEQEFGRFRDEFEVLGGHLKNARNKYDDASRRLMVIEERLAVKVESEPDQTALSGRKE